MTAINNFPLVNFDTSKFENILLRDINVSKEINFLGKIDDINPYSNTLTFANNSEYFAKAKEKGFEIILFNEKISDSDAAIFSENPQIDFLKITNWLNQNGKYKTFESEISKKITVGENVKIGKNVVIKDGVKIGNNVVIEDNSYINENVIIDDFVKIGGFGFEIANSDLLQFSGIHGGVIVGKNSLIKSFTNIDRSVWGLNTLIGSNVAIDSHVLIGHDVTIGDNVQIRGGSIIAGFSKIGQNTIVGIGSKFLQRSVLGKNSLSSANSIVSKNYEENTKVISQPSKIFKNN